MGRRSVSEKGNCDGVREIFGLAPKDKKKDGSPFSEIRAVAHTLVCVIIVKRGESVRMA